MEFISRRIGSLSTSDLNDLRSQKISQLEEAYQTRQPEKDIDLLTATIDSIDVEIKRRKPIVRRLNNSRKLALIVGPYPVTFVSGSFMMNDLSFRVHKFDNLRKAITFVFEGNI
jgi:hypothetical protein